MKGKTNHILLKTKEQESSTAGPRAWICLTWLMTPSVLDLTYHQCSEASNPTHERNVSFYPPPASPSPGLSLAVFESLHMSTSRWRGWSDCSVRGSGLRWRLSAFPDCHYNDVAELHKSAVSLSRLSIRNYALDLIPNSPLLLLCVTAHGAVAESHHTASLPSPPEW